MNLISLLQRFPENTYLKYIQTDIERYDRYFLSNNNVITMTSPITEEMIDIAQREHDERVSKYGYANSLELLSIEYVGRNLRELKFLFNELRKDAVETSLDHIHSLTNVDTSNIANKINSYI